MSRNRIYLGHPNERLHPAMPGWVATVRDLIDNNHAWNGWDLRTWEYDMHSALSVSDLTAAIRSVVGPCVLLRNVQQKVANGLRDRLHDHTVVLLGDAASSGDIQRLLQEARNLHMVGEPMLPRKQIIALLLIAKLRDQNMWGGRNKGYMWKSVLAKGRGLDEEFADQLPAVINDLFNKKLIIRKTSNGKHKYALNPDERKAIHDVIRTKTFPPDLHKVLTRDRRLDSARHLDSVIDQAISDGRAI